MNTPKEKSPLAQRIERRANALGLSIRYVGKQVGSEALVQNIMAGKSRSPRAENLKGVANVLHTTTDWLLEEKGPEVVEPDDPSTGLVVQPEAASPDVPVRGVAAGSHRRGAFQFTGDTIDYVARPPALASAKNLFAVYVVGDSMEPEHREGDLRFVAPDKPARSGDTVLIEARDDPNEPEWAMIGHLIRRGEEIVVGKLNPHAEVRVPRLSIKNIFKVLSQSELFGR